LGGGGAGFVGCVYVVGLGWVVGKTKKKWGGVVFWLGGGRGRTAAARGLRGGLSRAEPAGATSRRARGGGHRREERADSHEGAHKQKVQTELLRDGKKTGNFGYLSGGEACAMGVGEREKGVKEPVIALILESHLSEP